MRICAHEEDEHRGSELEEFRVPAAIEKFGDEELEGMLGNGFNHADYFRAAIFNQNFGRSALPGIIGRDGRERAKSIAEIERVHCDRRHISVFPPRKRYKPIRHRFAVGRRALRTWRNYMTDGARIDPFGVLEARPENDGRPKKGRCAKPRSVRRRAFKPPECEH